MPTDQPIESPKVKSKRTKKMSEKSLANLRPYKAGAEWTGNRFGAPKRKWITEVYEEMLQEKLADPAERKAFKDSVWEKMKSSKMVSAMTTDEVTERTEGKVTQTVDIEADVRLLSLGERMAKAEERVRARD